MLLYHIIIPVVNDMCDPLLSFGINYMYHCLHPGLLVTFHVLCQILTSDLTNNKLMHVTKNNIVGILPQSWFIGLLRILCLILTIDLINKMLVHVTKNYFVGFVFEHGFQ